MIQIIFIIYSYNIKREKKAVELNHINVKIKLI